MSRFILDCSVAMTWCFEDETSPLTESFLAALKSQGAIVPGHWPLEVANVLASAERRQRVTAAQMARFLANMDDLPIEIDDQTANRALRDVLALARTHRLTAYDAAYLELALRKGCPLASLDDRLNAAADGLGIKLFNG
jgi:predicted nucleic acid-binding protein